ncbi:hypothetical protein HYW18_02520 [Candidatus Uhrbacteria bacterium]|nr:hypothetical protein [Candidatus Uhrbacteria bacterium]
MRRLPILVAGLASVSLLAPLPALAHCPLCTAGAGLAALLAIKLGVSAMSVGVFIGAFAAAIGLWTHRLLKKSYIPAQAAILAILSFLFTILPLRIILAQYRSIYLSLSGPYGSWLNRTYLIDIFVAGSIIGAVLLIAAPSISRWVSRKRGGKLWPFQGISITAFLLVSAAIIIELLVWIPPFS